MLDKLYSNKYREVHMFHKQSIYLIKHNGTEVSREIPVQNERFTIGSTAGLSDLKLPKADGIEAEHCRIELVENHFQIRNTKAANTTYLNGEHVHFRRRLQSGQVLSIGGPRPEGRGESRTNPSPTHEFKIMIVENTIPTKTVSRSHRERSKTTGKFMLIQENVEVPVSRNSKPGKK